MKLKFLSSFLPLLVVFVLYYLFIPQHIQGGDTAELVASAYHRLVSHPPGYPIFQWLQFAWTHLLPSGSVFSRAALLNVFIGLAVLYLFVGSFEKLGLKLLILAVLATTPEFIEASVLPDVFALHALFVAGVAYSYLFMEPSRGAPWCGLLLALSFGNHHTTVLLFPCFLHLTIEAAKQKDNRYFTACGIGAVLTACLYVSILLLKHDHPLSWGDLQDLKSLLVHFLRIDYGTFQLSAGTQRGGTGAFLYLMKSTWPILLIAAVTLISALRSKPSMKHDPRLLTWGSCILLSYGFSFLMNVLPDEAGQEVLRRFHLMPMLLLVGLIVYLLRNHELSKSSRIMLLAVSLPALVLNGTYLPNFFRLKQDSTIEDYARNLLRTAREQAPSIVVVDNDSAYFAMRYLQAFDPAEEAVAVVTMPLFFHPWYLEKIKTLVPGFELPESERIFTSRELNQDRDVVKPNLERMNFFFTKHYKDGDQYQITFFSLGRMLSLGTGVTFQETPLKRSSPPSVTEAGPFQFTKLRLYYEYSHFHLAKAYHHTLSEANDQALASWEAALQKVPYCYPAMVNICELKPARRGVCEQLEFWKFATKNLY